MSDQNPRISLFLRLFTSFEVLVLIVGGIGIYFFGDAIRPIWPWNIPPFNAAFVGTIYLASVAELGMLVIVGRWAPARVLLPMLLIFTGVGEVASVLNLGIFQFQRWTTWLWFFLYTALPINSAFHIWLYRRQSTAQPISTPGMWRTYLLAQAIVLVLYGFGELVSPVVFSAFWLWKVDVFHGQLYSGAFIATGAGALLVSRRAARLEFLALGISQIGFGLFAIGGLLLVNSTLQRVNWSEPGTWLWIGGFFVVTCAGIGMLWHWRSMRWAAAQQVRMLEGTF